MEVQFKLDGKLVGERTGRPNFFVQSEYLFGVMVARIFITK